MCLENSHKYSLNFYVLGAFNIMYKHQDFFYDCHLLYSFSFFHQPHHFFRVLFTTQHGVFHNVNFLLPLRSFCLLFCTINRTNAFSKCWQFQADGKKGENKGRKSNCVTRYACLLPNADCCCHFFVLNP